MSDFVHLHLHSHYSLLDGLGKIPDILDRVSELNMKAVALTDHGTMYGIVEFVQEAAERGIQPVVGVEAYVAPGGHTKKRGKIDANPRHLTLLAENNEGYHNLLQLTSAAHLAGYYYKPRIDYRLLKKHSRGLIVLSGCMNSDISKAISENRPADAKRLIEWHIEVFGKDNFYLEVQHHPNIPVQGQNNLAVLEYATDYGLKVVATGDAHYLRPEDAEAQDVLVCVQTGKTVQDKDRLCMLGEDFSIKSPQEMSEAWAATPHVLATTAEIAERCQVKIEFGINRLPRYPLPKTQTADGALKELCEAGLTDRYGQNLPDGARDRLTYELDVIKKTGYASYFLIVADFVNEAKRRGILVGPGRGSAAGSLVAYVTNITNVDPLHYNLLFERFLNPERISMPDIDLDFADDRRDEVIEYVRDKYGQEYVAQIITFGTMAARAAVRDAGRALAYPYAFCDTVAKAIPFFTNFAEALGEGSELKKMYDGDPQVRRLIDTAKRLEGVARHASTHAAGVVIGDKPLVEYLPLQLASKEKGGRQSIVTQYAMGSVEALGLLKMDFLGLKNLTIIQRALDLIKQRHGIAIELDTLPLTDEKTYRLFQQGVTTGVFQLESAGMKRYLKELKPTEFEDIISMVALYRPGPMDSIPDFIAAKHGRKKITYLHPRLAPILEKTYGVIVTQDQVLQIAREFAGFTYAEADILRKAVGKKIKKLLDEQRTKFIQGAITAKGIEKTTARKVWDFIEPFARYGFNRAHAACYAMIAFQTAYLKANYTADFMAALLTSDEGNTDRQAIEVAESVSLDIPVLPPDVNESDKDFSVKKTAEGREAIRFGLGAIKNIGHNAVTAIIEERAARGPFKDIVDIFRRVNPSNLNRKSAESLAKSGAFDTLIERNHILQNLETLFTFSRALHKQQDAGQQNLFGAIARLSPPTVTLAQVPAAAKSERLAWEKELLGLYVSEHPLSEFQKEMSQSLTALADLAAMAADRSQAPVRIGGIITRLKKIVTKSNQPMLFVTIEDMSAGVEVLVFPKLLAGSSEQWVDGAGVVVEGKLSDKDGEAKILADRVWDLTSDILRELGKKPLLGGAGPTKSITTCVISLPLSFPAAELPRLREVLARAHVADGIPVKLVIPREGAAAMVNTPYRLPKTTQIPELLAAISPHMRIRYQ